MDIMTPMNHDESKEELSSETSSPCGFPHFLSQQEPRTRSTVLK